MMFKINKTRPQGVPKKITLPHNFTPRDYQREVFQQMNHGLRYVFLVWHTRSGKDKLCWQIIIREACKKLGSYLYLLPQKQQARSVIWEGRDKYGTTFLEHIPKEIIKKKNEKDMRIELVNGSVIKLNGARNYSPDTTHQFDGVVLSDYAHCKPSAFHDLHDIVSKNNGWMVLNTVPDGRNHAYDQWMIAENSDDWFTSLKTIKDTKDEKLEPVISDIDVEECIKSGMDQKTANQLFFCSWDS